MSGFRRLSLVLVAAFLLGAGQVVSIGASDGGIDVYSGGIDMHSNQISNLADPSSAQDAATRSWVNNNDQNTNAGTECSGSNYLAGDGTCMADSYEADTNTDASTECTGSDYLAGDGTCNADSFEADSYLPNDPPSTSIDINNQRFYDVGEIDFSSSGSIDYADTGLGSSEPDMKVTSEDYIFLEADNDGDGAGVGHCTVEGGGVLSCDGTKNWIHDLNKTHEAVYSSQESPEVRAVSEGQISVENGRVNVSLPAHFSGTVSDERPSLRVQVTPHELATVAVTERTDSWIVIESSKDVAVDYRVTGIREGYEDKEVVRERK